MKTLIKTKLLDGKYIELRSYEMFKTLLKVIYCPREDYETHSHKGDEYMTFTIKQQEKGKVVNTQRSKFYPYNYYKMYSFFWKPKAKIETCQVMNGNVRYVGNTAYFDNE